MRGKLTVAAVMPDGRIGLVEEDIPDATPGCVLLEVKSSLVSPGSELCRDGAASPGETPAPGPAAAQCPSATPTQESCWRRAKG